MLNIIMVTSHLGQEEVIKEFKELSTGFHLLLWEL